MNKLGTYRIFLRVMVLFLFSMLFFFFTSDLFHVRDMASD